MYSNNCLLTSAGLISKIFSFDRGSIYSYSWIDRYVHWITSSDVSWIFFRISNSVNDQGLRANPTRLNEKLSASFDRERFEYDWQGITRLWRKSGKILSSHYVLNISLRQVEFCLYMERTKYSNGWCYWQGIKTCASIDICLQELFIKWSFFLYVFSLWGEASGRSLRLLITCDDELWTSFNSVLIDVHPLIDVTNSIGIFLSKTKMIVAAID